MLHALLLSFGLGALDAQPALYVDRVAAVVGEHVILLSEVRSRASLVARSQHVTVAQLTDAILRQVAEHLVEEQLIDAEAKRLNVVIAPEEVDRAIEQLATEKDVRARYEQMKRQVKDPKDLKTYDELKQEIVNELLQERIQALREDWVAQLRAKVYVEVRTVGCSLAPLLRCL
jgi:hypothetical protein